MALHSQQAGKAMMRGK